MPRISELREYVTLEEAEEDPGEYWDPCDYCNDCFKKACLAADLHDELYAEHPPYEDVMYICDSCGRKLTAKDN